MKKRRRYLPTFIRKPSKATIPGIGEHPRQIGTEYFPHPGFAVTAIQHQAGQGFEAAGRVQIVGEQIARFILKRRRDSQMFAFANVLAKAFNKLRGQLGW